MADIHLVQAKCAANATPCSNVHVPTRASPSLFVISAHLTNKANAALLRSALRSLRCHHPRDSVLIVDNDSPHPGVAGTLALDRNLMEASEEALYGVVRITRRKPSLAVLSAWAAADEALRLPHLYGFPRDIDRVIFMQHSMRLCQPVPPPPNGCAATALSGFLNTRCIQMGRSGGRWCGRTEHYTQELGWVSQLAEAAGIACDTPCHRRGPPCGKEHPCVRWASATHWAIAYTREGFHRFASYQLWPPLSGSWELPQAARDIIQDPEHRWSNGSTRVRPVSSGDFIVGLERLAGLTLAWLNWVNNSQQRHFAECASVSWHDNPDAVLFEKVHGSQI